MSTKEQPVEVTQVAQSSFEVADGTQLAYEYKTSLHDLMKTN